MKQKFLKTLILINILLVPILACTGNFLQSTSTPPLPIMQGFGAEYNPELLISLKWGLNPNEMPPFITRIQSLDWECCGGKADAIIKMRPEFLQYIGDDNHFYVLTIHNATKPPFLTYPKFDLLEFTSDGKLQNRYHLQANDTFINHYRVSSFVVQNGYVYLHESIFNSDNGQERVRKISLEGNIGKDIWQTVISENFWALENENSKDEILIDNNYVYLFSWSNRVLGLDIETGKITKNFFLSKETFGSSVLSPTGRFYALGGLGTDPFFVSCDADTGDCNNIVISRDLHSGVLFNTPILGTDKKYRIYANISYTGDEISVFTLTGDEIAAFMIPDVIVKNVNKLYFGFWDSKAKTMRVRLWEESGQVGEDIFLKLPTKSTEKFESLAQLIQINQDGYFIYSNSDSILYQYDLKGRLSNTRLLEGEDSAMTAYNRSEALFDFESVRAGVNIDQEGRIYLTIMDPEGFKVVRLNLVLPENDTKK